MQVLAPGLQGRDTSSAVIVVVVRLRVTVIPLYHGERHVSPRSTLCPIHPLGGAPVREVPVDGEVRIVLELELLLSRDCNVVII